MRPISRDLRGWRFSNAKRPKARISGSQRPQILPPLSTGSRADERQALQLSIAFLGERIMSNVALVPSFAPFSREDIAALNTIVSKSSREQRAWLSGFLAGLDAAANAAAQPAPAAPPRAKVPLTILYASESGNAEGLALAAK